MRRRAAPEYELCSLTWPYLCLLFFEYRAIALRSHLIRKQVEKSVGGLFARRAVVVLNLKRLHHSGRNAGMLENTPVDRVLRSRDHGSFGNPWRYGDRWHAHAQPVEFEWRARSGGFRGRFEGVLYASRRRRMVINAAVLVIGNQQQSALP